MPAGAHRQARFELGKGMFRAHVLALALREPTRVGRLVGSHREEAFLNSFLQTVIITMCVYVWRTEDGVACEVDECSLGWLGQGEQGC